MAQPHDVCMNVAMGVTWSNAIEVIGMFSRVHCWSDCLLLFLLVIQTAIINLIDLAGSERVSGTGATGDRLKEGSAINLVCTRCTADTLCFLHKLSCVVVRPNVWLARMPRSVEALSLCASPAAAPVRPPHSFGPYHAGKTQSLHEIYQ